MKKMFFVLFVLLFFNFAYGMNLDFSQKGDENSNKILFEFILGEIPSVDFDVVSYFYDLDNDNQQEILGIIKSNLFYNLKGYKLFILTNKNQEWVAVHSDINFDNSKPVKIKNNKITYYGGALYNGKKYHARYKKGSIKTSDKIFDYKRNRKMGAIEDLTIPDESRNKNFVDINDFNASEQKNVKIYYKNLSPKTKHYLHMQ